MKALKNISGFFWFYIGLFWYICNGYRLGAVGDLEVQSLKLITKLNK